MASSDSIWNDCLTRNTQRLLYEARSVWGGFLTQNFFSLFFFFNRQQEKWLTLHLPGQYFAHGCVLTPPPWALTQHSTRAWIPHNALRLHARAIRRYTVIQHNQGGLSKSQRAEVEGRRGGESGWGGAVWAHYWKFKTHAHTVNCLQQTENDSLCVL